MNSSGRVHRQRTERTLTAVTSKWVLLTCLFGGGGVPWLLGTPVAQALVVTAAMAILAGAVAGMLRPTGASGSVRVSGPTGVSRQTGQVRRTPALRRGTEQAALVRGFDRYVADLAEFRHSAELPDALTGPAVEAFVAASGARDVAVRVARAVDALDTALHRAYEVGQGLPPSAAAADSLARMYDRRDRLMAALQEGLAQVQDLHAKLLELSATLELYGGGTVGAEVSDVGRTLDLLRRAFAELDVPATASSASSSLEVRRP
jgi:hypothetical protein